jgi:hypothetical protein
MKQQVSRGRTFLRLAWVELSEPTPTLSRGFRMSRLQFLSTGLLLALVTVPSANAQSAQRWSIQASGIGVLVQGEAYAGLKAGGGVELQARLTPSVWSFGVGLQGSSHDADFQGSTETVTLAGVFFEPRRIIDVGSESMAPYVSARLAYLQQSIDLDTGNGVVSASTGGTQINGGGGVLFRMTPRVNLDLGATYGLINFGDVVVNIPGSGSVTIEGSSGSGRNLVLRAGLAIGLGK